jgi:glycosyltransferase involved in cell wall biosynthesis
MAGKKVIMHHHGGEYQRYWRQMTVRQRRRTLELLTKVSALIVLGDAWREFFVGLGVPAERVVSMRNPVNLPKSIPDRLGRERVGFLFLGVLVHRKGAFDLLDAIRTLPSDTLATFHFVMAGNGQVEELRSLVAKYGLNASVEVRSWVDQKERDQLLAEADVFVLPSRNEGLPMAMLEAMAWGLPAICTAVGSIPEILVDGQNGLLITPGNLEQLANAISHLGTVEKDRLALGQAARNSVETLASEIYVRKLLQLYKSVIGGTDLVQHS